MPKFLSKLSLTAIVSFFAYEGFAFSLLCINTPNDASLFLGLLVLVALFVITPYTFTRIWRPNNEAGSDNLRS